MRYMRDKERADDGARYAQDMLLLFRFSMMPRRRRYCCCHDERKAAKEERGSR